MTMSDRRAHKRYVVDDLKVEVGGVVHETVDISIRAVAVVRRPGVDYEKIQAPYRFASDKAAPLSRPILHLHRLYERGLIVVLDYYMGVDEWEALLTAHDVRADVEPLQDVFE
jgi:hypothetical protein